MSMSKPLFLYLYWDCSIRRDARGNFFDGKVKKTLTIRQQIQYAELVNKICAYRGVDRSRVKLSIALRCPLFYGSDVQYTTLQIADDEDMRNLWYMSSNQKISGIELHVSMLPVECGPSASAKAVHSGGTNMALLAQKQNALLRNNLVNPRPLHRPVNAQAVHGNVGSKSNFLANANRIHHRQVQIPEATASFTSCNAQLRSKQSMPVVGAVNDNILRNSPIPSVPQTIDNIPTHETAEPQMIEGPANILDAIGETTNIDRLAKPDDRGTNGNGNLPLSSTEPNQPNQPAGCLDKSPGLTSLKNFRSFHASDDMEKSPSVCIDDIWSESNSELRHGMRFIAKWQVTYAVELCSTRVGCQFFVNENSSRTWAAQCKAKNEGSICNWYIEVICKSTHGMWEITKWNGKHTCINQEVSSDHRNLTAKFIAQNILDMVRKDSNLKVKDIIAYVKDKFHYTVTYTRARNALLQAQEVVYGNQPANDPSKKRPLAFKFLAVDQDHVTPCDRRIRQKLGDIHLQDHEKAGPASASRLKEVEVEVGTTAVDGTTSKST